MPDNHFLQKDTDTDLQQSGRLLASKTRPLSVTKADCIYATVTASFTCLPQLQLEMVWSCCRPATEGNEGWGELWQWFWQWHFSTVYSRLGCKVFSSGIWMDTYQSSLKQSTVLSAFKGYLVECPFLTTNSTMNYHSDAWLPASC